MRIGKVLIVDGDEKARACVSTLLLNSARQRSEGAGSLQEAVELLKTSNYVCVFLACEIPVLPGQTDCDSHGHGNAWRYDRICHGSLL